MTRRCPLGIIHNDNPGGAFPAVSLRATMNLVRSLFGISFFIFIFSNNMVHGQEGPLPGTKLLPEDDYAKKMVQVIRADLLKETDKVKQATHQRWLAAVGIPNELPNYIAQQRAALRHSLGMIDPLIESLRIELVGTLEQPALWHQGPDYSVYHIRWEYLPGVYGRGLLLEPKGKVVANAICLPDAGTAPEVAAGLVLPGEHESAFGIPLATAGVRVFIPELINRDDQFSGSTLVNRWTNQPHREFIYRMAYEMGRHVIGYELQSILALVRYCQAKDPTLSMNVVGIGEGGHLALFAGAIDEQIRHTMVVGSFGDQTKRWQQPIDRNIWALHQIANSSALGFLCIHGKAPRTLAIQQAPTRTATFPLPVKPQRSAGGAPGKLEPIPAEEYAAQVEQLQALVRAGGKEQSITALPANDTTFDEIIIRTDNASLKLANTAMPKPLATIPSSAAERQQLLVQDQIAFTQRAWRNSDAVRQAQFDPLLKHLQPASRNDAAYQQGIEQARSFFWEEVIGKIPLAPAGTNVEASSRLWKETPRWTGYEIQLRTSGEIFAYGILLLPKNLKPKERRPVVVCQHGLEGTAQVVCDPELPSTPYRAQGAQLADLGYIVFSPQNPYIGKDDFRVLQRMANPLKRSLFSYIIYQHDIILRWLKLGANVDAKRIGFYGLSYGGKTAMRVPAVLPDYCLSICSADFNEWIGKNVSLGLRSSYMFTGEYEMPEFQLGQTFNYAEMAYLIAPRPFMVERGHDDGVGIDEMVAYEYAKVRRYYARLQKPDATRIEFFDGGHVIHGKGTFEFLAQHLQWPTKK
ncbi:MAG: hypothetical protein R3B84_18775 [Zavarzinella sp.]